MKIEILAMLAVLFSVGLVDADRMDDPNTLKLIVTDQWGYEHDSMIWYDIGAGRWMLGFSDDRTPTPIFLCGNETGFIQMRW